MAGLTCPSIVTMRSVPAFSVTMSRPSGKEVTAQGLFKLRVRMVTAYEAEVAIPGARVCPAKAGL